MAWDNANKRVALIYFWKVFGGAGFVNFFQLPAQVTLTVTLHLRLIAVDAKVGGDVLLIEFIIAYYAQLHQALSRKRYKNNYGNYRFHSSKGTGRRYAIKN